MERPLIVAKNLQKRYQMGEVTVHALRGVDLTLHDGELVVVLGPAAPGKVPCSILSAGWITQ